MRLKFERGQFSIDPTMDYEELTKQSPLVAVLAQHDLITDHKEYKYTIVDGVLYGFLERVGATGEWCYFDTATRHWRTCNKPEGK